MRNTNIITHRTETTVPQDLLFFDSETLPQPQAAIGGGELHRLRLGVAIYIRYERGQATRRSKLLFREWTEFVEFVISKMRSGHNLWAFAHNLGFDAQICGVFEALERGLLSFEIPEKDRKHKEKKGNDAKVRQGLFISDDPPTVIECCDSRGYKVRFVDTLNYWRCSLARLGESVGQAKLEMPKFAAPDEEWFHYCEHDVLVLEKSICKLLDWIVEENLGKLCLTAPSQAMGAYRRRFMPHVIETHNNAECRNLERCGYYGGQLECWRIGEIIGPIYQLDVASLYPSVMKGNLYPCKLEGYESRQRRDGQSIVPLGVHGIADVLIDTYDRTYPFRTQAGMVFPIGQYWTTLVGPELDYALKAGHVKSMASWATYRLAPIFDDFVTYFWNKRKDYKQSGDNVYETFCKLMMNSLYGKFGEKSPAWEWDDKTESDIRWGTFEDCSDNGDEPTTYRAIAGRVQRQIEREEHPRAFPAIAAYVTAYGRQRMFQLRKICGDGNYFYMATDSLYTNKGGYLHLSDAGEIQNNELGKLKLEAIADSAHFRSANNYRFGDKQVRGSIKSRAVQLSDRQFIEPRFQHLASMLKSNDHLSVVIDEVIKTLQERYSKGTVTKSGDVIPLVAKQREAYEIRSASGNTL